MMQVILIHISLCYLDNSDSQSSVKASILLLYKVANDLQVKNPQWFIISIPEQVLNVHIARVPGHIGFIHAISAPLGVFLPYRHCDVRAYGNTNTKAYN